MEVKEKKLKLKKKKEKKVGMNLFQNIPTIMQKNFLTCNQINLALDLFSLWWQEMQSIVH